MSPDRAGRPPAPPPRARRRGALWLWGPPVLAMALIFLVSSIPGVRAPGVSDKTAHALAYGGLALLILRALVAGDWRGVTAPAVLQAALAASAYGAVDEWHQSFVRDRAAEMADVWADATGAAIAAGAVWAWSIIRRLRRRSSGRDAVRTPDRRA